MVDEVRYAPDEDTEPDIQPEDREAELTKLKSVREALEGVYRDVRQGFTDSYERADKTLDYWDIYHCKLGPKQFFTGRSEIYVPIVHNAINARKTRFTNQVFPISGRYVEVTSEDGSLPHALIALAEFYVRKARLRTEVLPALVKSGDVEGQYNLYVTWRKTKRHVAWRTSKAVTIEGFEFDDEEVEDIQEDTLTHGAPMVEVLSDNDVLVLPATADSIEQALEDGGSVTILRRWRKAKIERLIAEEEIVKDAGKTLVQEMTKYEQTSQQDTPKKMTSDAGIKGNNKSAYAEVFETWTKLTIKGERRICRAYFGGSAQLLGCKRNPFWSDHLPIISVPVDKIHGSFKGRSKIEAVASLQYEANDAVNQAMTASPYTFNPIFMTDPVKNPRIGSMFIAPGAIWETSPNDTAPVKVDPIWKDALEVVLHATNLIMQTLSVNPAMITQLPQKQKQNQAQIAQEQQVEILSTADAVTVLEEGVLTPLINRFIELDHQYREDDLLIAQKGEMGMQASIQRIPPVQFNQRYQFRWFGVESARNAQQMQQQIAGLNVLRGIPPEQLNGYKLNLVPAAVQMVENLFGPRLSPLIFESPERQMPVPIEQENMLLVNGFEVPTHDMDDDNAHIQGHAQLMQMAQANENVGGAVVKKIQTHIWKHMQQAQKKQQMAMQQASGHIGAPGGAGPGIAGTPRPGAVPTQPRGGQGPPGMIHQDRLRDPMAMPRKM